MKKLSITTAWNETAPFVKRQFGLLFLIAFGLVALPTIILQAAMPAATPGQPPEGGSWMLLIIPVIVLGVVGSLTITTLALARATDAREAFSHALRRFAAVLLATLLLGVAAALVALPVAVILVLLAGTGPGALVLVTLAIVLAFVFVWVRMMLLNPVGAVEPVGPVAILRRSWMLTAGRFWKLLGFLVIMVILFLVVTFAVSAVLGSVIILVAGQPQDGNLTQVLLLLLNGLLNAGFSVVLTVMIARIYAQLAGEGINGS